MMQKPYALTCDIIILCFYTNTDTVTKLNIQEIFTKLFGTTEDRFDTSGNDWNRNRNEKTFINDTLFKK